MDDESSLLPIMATTVVFLLMVLFAVAFFLGVLVGKWL